MTYPALRRQPRHMASKQAPVWVDLARGAFVFAVWAVLLLVVLYDRDLLAFFDWSR